MSAPNIDSNRRAPLLSRFQRELTDTSSAQEVLWREWRNCDDADYARYLFGLVVDQPLNESALGVFGLIGAILGAVGGLLISLLGWDVGGIPGLPAGLVVGLVIALAAGLALRRGGRNRWRVWLGGFVPDEPIFGRTGVLNLAALYVVLVLGLGSGVGAGVSGALFFGQGNILAYSALAALGIIVILGIASHKKASLVSGTIGAVAGGIFGALFGLGAAQIAGSLLGPLDTLNSARVAGLAVGFAFGWFWGREAGLIGLFITQVALTGLILATSSDNAVLLGWLLGLLAGGVLGSYSRLWHPADRSLSFENAYAYRRACLWWAGRLPAAQVEAALAAQSGQEGLLQRLREQVVSTAMVRSAASGKAVLADRIRRRGWWSSVWRYLYLGSLIGGAPASPEETQTAGKPGQPWGPAEAAEDLLKDLQAATWQERFMARHALVALGGEAVPKLLDFARAGKSYDLGVWLIRSIAYETGWRLADECRLWFCPACLTACGGHTVKCSYDLSVTYYGCRTCGQSRHLLYCPQGVVAVLDAEWAEAYSYQDNRLRANWLVCRTLFDFDAVEIIRAADEDVERLAMNAGNDTDPARKARYAHIRCVVAPECRLSENSLRVLGQVFGQVESRATLQS